MSTIKDNSKSIISLNNYNKLNVPAVVGNVGSEVSCPYKKQMILRMPVSVDGEEPQIPSELEWLKPVIKQARDYQKQIIRVNHSFLYITVRHGLTESVTDDQWHVDGFSTKITHIPEQNYIYTTNDPTEFKIGAVLFPEDFNPNKHNINNFLSNKLSKGFVLNSKPNTLYCMDPYILHRRPPSTQGKQRTFVRISFVPIEINDINNTQNPLIPREYTKDGISMRNKLEIY